MKFLKIFLVGIAFMVGTFGVAADEVPIEIKSTTGAAVMVMPYEVKKAYLALVQRKSKNAETILANEDGSVAITRPYFEYNGKLLRIDWNYSSGEGACKRFGFEKNVGKEYETVPGDATVAVLSEGGRLQNLLPGHEVSQRTVLETVACQ